MEILLREHDTEVFVTKSLEEFDEIVINDTDDEARERKTKLKEELRKKERKC